MQVSVGKNDEPDILREGILACLLLADKGIVFLGLGLQDGERETAFVEQEVINEAVGGLLEVIAKRIKREQAAKG